MGGRCIELSSASEERFKMSNDQRVRGGEGEKEGHNIVRRSGDQSIVLHTSHSAL